MPENTVVLLTSFEKLIKQDWKLAGKCIPIKEFVATNCHYLPDHLPVVGASIKIRYYYWNIDPLIYLKLHLSMPIHHRAHSHVYLQFFMPNHFQQIRSKFYKTITNITRGNQRQSQNFEIMHCAWLSIDAVSSAASDKEQFSTITRFFHYLSASFSLSFSMSLLAYPSLVIFYFARYRLFITAQIIVHVEVFTNRTPIWLLCIIRKYVVGHIGVWLWVLCVDSFLLLLLLRVQYTEVSKQWMHTAHCKLHTLILRKHLTIILIIIIHSSHINLFVCCGRSAICSFRHSLAYRRLRLVARWFCFRTKQHTHTHWPTNKSDADGHVCICMAF